MTDHKLIKYLGKNHWLCYISSQLIKTVSDFEEEKEAKDFIESILQKDSYKEVDKFMSYPHDQPYFTIPKDDFKYFSSSVLDDLTVDDGHSWESVFFSLCRHGHLEFMKWCSGNGKFDSLKKVKTAQIIETVKKKSFWASSKTKTETKVEILDLFRDEILSKCIKIIIKNDYSDDRLFTFEDTKVHEALMWITSKTENAGELFDKGVSIKQSKYIGFMVWLRSEYKASFTGVYYISSVESNKLEFTLKKVKFLKTHDIPFSLSSVKDELDLLLYILDKKDVEGFKTLINAHSLTYWLNHENVVPMLYTFMIEHNLLNIIDRSLLYDFYGSYLEISQLEWLRDELKAEPPTPQVMLKHLDNFARNIWSPSKNNSENIAKWFCENYPNILTSLDIVDNILIPIIREFSMYRRQGQGVNTSLISRAIWIVEMISDRIQINRLFDETVKCKCLPIARYIYKHNDLPPPKDIYDHGENGQITKEKMDFCFLIQVMWKNH